MRNKTRPAGIALMGLGLLATILFLAGPASAADAPMPPHDSLGPNANHGSTSSGTGHADHGSTVSGDAIAVGGSTASGCSTAANGSTASGGECVPRHVVHPDKAREAKHHKAGHRGAAPATAVGTRSLAVTGSATGPLVALAAGLLALGALLMVLTSDRRRAPVTLA